MKLRCLSVHKHIEDLAAFQCDILSVRNNGYIFIFPHISHSPLYNPVTIQPCIFARLNCYVICFSFFQQYKPVCPLIP